MNNAELSLKRSELHARNDIAGAIPLQREILRRLEEHGRPPRDIANAHNYLSVLYAKSKEYAMAEDHARQALALHTPEDTLPSHDALACYSMVLARILVQSQRRAEAIPFAETALREWTIVHNPMNDFLRARMAELTALRSGTWTGDFNT